MIRARLSDGTFIIGIDAENVRRLRRGQPLEIDLELMGGQGRVVVMYGETMQAIIKELEEASGQKLPPPMPLPTRGPKGGH